MKKIIVLFCVIGTHLICLGQNDTLHPSDIGYSPNTEPIDEYTSEIRNNVAYIYNNDKRLVAENSVKKIGLFKKKYTRTGLNVEYTETGSIRCIGSYIKNKKEGLWQYYTKDGKLQREEYWQNDFEVGYKYLIPPEHPIQTSSPK